MHGMVVIGVVVIGVLDIGGSVGGTVGVTIHPSWPSVLSDK